LLLNNLYGERGRDREGRERERGEKERVKNHLQAPSSGSLNQKLIITLQYFLLVI
jgi:hypothetical protein